MRFHVASTRHCAIIDIEQLLQPISDDCRGGDVNAYTRELRQQLSELRNPPRSANPDDPEQDGGLEPINWNAILRISSDALAHTTKDLRIACHFTEAALNLNGLSGLLEGLTLIHRLVQNYWQDLAPQLDSNDPETRCAPLENLLNDPVHGPRLPTTIRSLNLLSIGELRLSLLVAMRPDDDLTAASIASSLRQISVDDAKQLSNDLDDSVRTLEALQHDLIVRMSDYAPSFNHLQESLGLIRHWFDNALKQQLQICEPNASETVQNCGTDGSVTASHSKTQPTRINAGFGNEPDAAFLAEQSMRVRADAYRQLTDAANVLQRIEPHSPIPYMIHRAVQMGQMPFPKLMSQWVKEESTLEMFCRELGLTSTDSQETRAER
ncbi:MAG TPA: type VI secretion system protein TssA [Planctomycetaceae bacterium]|nr:type VI secretion system protein TssA [Planctomycetaceae bacterium]